jgi:hypothetical protein
MQPTDITNKLPEEKVAARRLLLLFFAYIGIVPYRSCVVSFTDVEGVEHSVRVSPASLYEAVMSEKSIGLSQVVITSCV